MMIVVFFFYHQESVISKVLGWETNTVKSSFSFIHFGRRVLLLPSQVKLQSGRGRRWVQEVYDRNYFLSAFFLFFFPLLLLFLFLKMSSLNWEIEKREKKKKGK
ncbi:hypothetical protein L873DRAFT_551240 [Choiromyces venosus 120613-1]|uniref:Uncharacterized protein n=1 Tax=Choiromyces venosus 120613-1 TaxID=1336337 RepID=A0A3N4K5M5_9PEZI|nr:hypothetical protein L873DRAFT_551240 [Choiromyces venosus 120613-1]